MWHYLSPVNAPNSALSSRNYVFYIVGGTISMHGMWIYRVALGWYAWELTHSELWVGIVASTQFAPAVIFGPIFGVLADRFDRRAASILINVLSFINMSVLALLISLGAMDIRVLGLLSLGQGVLDGAHSPVRMSIVPNLVNRNQLTSAIALTSVAFNMSRFIGPALAGLIIAGFGVSTAFALNGFSYLGVVASMMVITLNPTSLKRESHQHPLTELLEGARYVATHTTIRGLLMVAALSSVFGRGALEMLPVFADEIFGGGASALAILTSAIGAGAVIIGLTVSRSSHWLTVQVIEVALVMAGILVIVLGLSHSLAVGVVVVCLLGMTLSMCGIGAQILIQSLVDDEIRGRVSSFWGMIAFGGTSLGALLVGSTAHFAGLKAAVVSAGIICAGMTSWKIWRRQRDQARTAN